jgi:hypothetical protein
MMLLEDKVFGFPSVLAELRIRSDLREKIMGGPTK